MPAWLRGYLDVFNLARRWRNRRTDFPQALDVKCDSFADRYRIAHEKVSHFSRPACSLGANLKTEVLAELLEFAQIYSGLARKDGVLVSTQVIRGVTRTNTREDNDVICVGD